MAILRTIEKRIRRSILHLLDSSEHLRPGETDVIRLPDRPRILLIRVDRIGDAIISTPTIELLRDLFPDGKIDILLGEKNSVIAPLLPSIDRYYILEKGIVAALKTLRRLRRNRYDAVLNLHLNRSASASLASRLAKGKVTLEYPEENPFSRDEVSRLPHVAVMTARLAEVLGSRPITEESERSHPLLLRLPSDSIDRATNVMQTLLPDEAEGKKVLMNISASRLSRSWPTDHCIGAAVALRRKGMIPMICGISADADRVAEIASKSGSVRVPPLTRYGDFAGIVAAADIVVTPDTSTTHLAAALGRPTITLYTSAMMARLWYPWGVPHRTIVDPEGMQAMQPDQVVRAVCELAEEIEIREQSERTARTEIPTRSV